MISDPAADAALRGLSSALLGLLDQGTRPPCADGTDRWLDDSATVRATAAPVCDDCEIRPRCRDFANTARPRITFGIFGGVDFSETARQTRQPTAPTGETS
jgi:Transcription factor WhiB